MVFVPPAPKSLFSFGVQSQYGISLASFVLEPSCIKFTDFQSEPRVKQCGAHGWVYSNLTTWQIASDFIQGAEPGLAPSTYAAGAGEVVSGYWDDIWSGR